ncbi:hypothetical protein LCGC14_1190900 [marine sediment metagenome]|uniref:Uncharacterized protein n=1 Tax=marine sediment metagenome TaxID=412755 RepID=A0A0F9LJE9_9ZZZZ
MQAEKHCVRCERTLPITDFSLNVRTKTGYDAYCKTCKKEYDHARYVGSIDRVKARAKRYAAEHPEQARVSHQKYERAHRQEKAERNQIYRRKPDARERHRLHMRRFHSQHPERAQCLSATQKQVKTGALLRFTTCGACGEKKRVEYHHEDYSKPFEVIALCRKCHLAVHGKQIRLA